MPKATNRYENHNPASAVDLIIEVYDIGKKPNYNAQLRDITYETDVTPGMKGIVLIIRGKEPYKGMWALPGGFQEPGHSLEKTAAKEAREETSLEVELIDQLRVYSDKDRDPRCHTNSVGYVCRAEGEPKAGDDAALAKVFPLNELPKELAFDHQKRINEYKRWLEKFKWERQKRLEEWIKGRE